jgi:ketosteroid isomerase-like protein
MSAELLARDTQWVAAIRDRDVAAAAGIVADDFALVLVHPAVAVVDRDRWLAMLPEYVVHSWEVEERIVDVRGDAGLILQRVLMEATVLGEDRSGRFVLSDAWLCSDGAWRVWRRHSTPLTAGAMPSSAPA